MEEVKIFNRIKLKKKTSNFIADLDYYSYTQNEEICSLGYLSLARLAVTLLLSDFCAQERSTFCTLSAEVVIHRNVKYCEQKL